MKLLIINASPKAKQSITLQHIHYLEKKHPEHAFEILHIGKKTGAYENNPKLLDEIFQKITHSDALIWCFPVYYTLVPYQLKRVIELLFSHFGKGCFQGTYATGFSTSINFFDHTAHNYIQGVSEDLGLNYVDAYSAHMQDFFDDDERRKMEAFFTWFTEIVNQKLPVSRKYNFEPGQAVCYTPDFDAVAKKIPLESKTLLLTDEQETDTNLKGMTQMFGHLTDGKITIKNIHDIDIRNGCLGCCTCGYDNTCIQKDSYVQFYNDNLKNADTIIIAGSIKDHFLSSQWKKFLDRSFFNGHAPVLKGKRLGYIISGPLTRLQNLREILDALAQGWHMKSIDIVTDEHESSEMITKQLSAFAQKLTIANQTGLESGARFYQVGGGKIFRDFIFNTTAVFKADHLFYEKMGMYNTFPHRQLKKRIHNAIFSLFVSIKPLRKKIHKKFIPEMVAPYKAALKKNT